MTKLRLLMKNCCLIILLMLGLLNFSAIAMADMDWSHPMDHSPNCSFQGEACRFDGDCCQGTCKDHMVCDGELYCRDVKVVCDFNQDCCSGLCGASTHQCEPSN